jgi:hypothetical protein
MKSTILAVTLAAAGLGMFAEPATASGSGPSQPPTSEHAWAMRQILSDIQEMAGKPAAIPDAQVGSMIPWTPADPLTAFAAAQLGRSAVGGNSALADQYPALIHAGTEQLFAGSAVVSAALKANMRDPKAHEAAAILLGAFGLQEAAAAFTDHRWVMNRMTAHLAVAAALRGTAPMSVDGQLARAILDALVGRQKTALDALAVLGDPQADSPKAAWQRALMIRVTQDWRLLKTPATATRREKLEYFRARRAMLDGRSGLELELLREPPASDFARIAHLNSPGVEDGNEFVADSLMRELSELSKLYQREFKRPMPPSLPDAINDRAGLLMTSKSPRVLPWGAWAEFSQRHIAMAVADTDMHYRGMLGLPDRADELNEAIDDVLKTLRMFSVASISRHVDSESKQHDTTYLREATDVLVTMPEMITAAQWRTFEVVARDALTPSSVPSGRKWFIEPSGLVPYETSDRFKNTAISLAALRPLVEAQPHNSWILWRVDSWKGAPADLRAHVDGLISQRAPFELWALDRAIDRSTSRAEWEPLLRRGCALSPERCLALAGRLVPLDEHSAAVEYQRAFDHPGLDRVTAANSSEWLVFFYERNNEPQRARALAASASNVGSHRGMRTLARLLERRGEAEAAGELFEAIAERYPTATATLAGFLYRRVVVHRDTRFTTRWDAVRQRTFPNGLVPEPASTEKPAAGVYVDRDRPSSERVRLQVGDIIVGVDGWRVDNLEQFEMVLAFNDQLNTHKLTAWRGVLLSVGVPTAHGLGLETYPVKGWAQ